MPKGRPKGSKNKEKEEDEIKPEDYADYGDYLAAKKGKE